MHARIIALTDKESRILHDVDRMLAQYRERKPFSNREQPQWDIFESIISDLEYLRDEIVLASDGKTS